MKKNVKLLILSLIASLAFTSSLAACDFGGTTNSGSGSGNQTTDTGSSDTGSDEQEEVTITLVGTESITRFASKQLTPVITGTEEVPTWTTSNPAVATVDENGLVSALTLGETVITAKIGDVKAECTVTVVETDIPHEIEVSLEEVVLFEEESQEVSVSVSYDGEDVAGDYVYTWSLVDGDEDVVSITTAENGKKAVFTGLKVGTVTYEIYTEARGYEAAKEITITVNPNSYTLEIAHPDVKPIETGYAVALALGDSATDNVTFGDAYLAVNGIQSQENVSITWTSDNDNAVLDNGTITAYKKGTTVFTGTATYKGEALSVSLTVAIEKGQAAIEDTDMIEVATAETFTIPASVSVGQVEKVYIGENVLFDKEAEKGSIDGSVVTVDKAGLPAKAEYLGEGQTLAIETNLVVYTMSVDVYTMIINSVEELDSWQEVAAENAIRAGLCIEEQKGLVYNGYFVLGNNINYNKVWSSYKKYGDLWALCYQNRNIWKEEYQSEYDAIGNSDKRNQIVADAFAAGKMLDGTIIEDWGKGDGGGFKGTFDGQGYYIDGLENSGVYSAFIVTMGGGTVKNIAFTNMKIGSGSNTVADRGNGLLENIYVEVNSIASGENDGTATWGFIRSGVNVIHTVTSVIIDYTDANLNGLQNAYIGCDIQSEPLQGVYVVGVPESYKGAIWNHEGVERHQLGSYKTPQDLFKDEKAVVLVNSWSSAFWTIKDGLALPTSVCDMFAGDFSFVNTDTKVPANGSLKVSTDEDERYIVYSVSGNEKVAVNGNVVEVAPDAEVGSTFTVTATSLVSGKTATLELTVDTYLEKVEAKNRVDVDLGLTLSGTTFNKAATATVDLSEIYQAITGQTVTVTYKGETVYTGAIESAEWTMSLDKFALTDSGDAELIFTYSTADKNGYYSLPINIVQTAVELNSDNVKNATTLQAIFNANPSAHFVLTSDLDLSGTGLKVISEFNGILDGQGYMIKNTWLHHDSDTNGYNPRWIITNNGTIKNIRFDLNYFTYTTGGRGRGLASTNNGTISNVYVNVTFNQTMRDDQDITYFNAGVISKENYGSINNTIVNVTVVAGLNIRTTTLAGIVFENKGTLYNCYTLNNGCEAVVAAQKGGSETTVAYVDWFEVNTAAMTVENGWTNVWTVSEKGEVYFGNAMVFDNIKTISTEYKTDPTNGNKVTIANEAFTVGSTWSVSVSGGVAQEVTIETEGEYTLAIDPASVSEYKNSVVFSNESGEYKYNNVIVITPITTAEELYNLAVGGNATTGLHRNSDVAGNDKLGYYMLVNDIDCSTIELYAGGYSYLQSYFKGVFDGNGYTIKNITLGAGGIFGGLYGATIKNVKMENVVLNAMNSNKDEFWGNYTAIFASKAVHTTFTNIDVKISSVSLAVGKPEMLDGLMTSMGSDNCVYTDITIDATGLALEGILGSYFFANNKATNFVIKAASYSLFGFNGAEATKDGDVWTTYEPMTSFEGITFVDTDEVTA